MHLGRFQAAIGTVGLLWATQLWAGAPGATIPIVPPAKPATTFEKVAYVLTGGLDDRHDEIAIYADGRIETPESLARIAARKAKSKSSRSEQEEHADKDKDKKSSSKKDAASANDKEKDRARDKEEERRPPAILNHYLLQEDLNKLSDLVKQIDWRQIRPVYASRMSTTDGFAEKVSAVIAGERFETVITDPDAHMPTGFQSLVAYLKELQGTYGVFGQPDRTTPGDFARLRWINKTTSGSEEYSTSLEIANDLSFNAWQRRKRTVWGLWTEEKVIRSLRGTLGTQEFRKLQKLVEGIGWDKLGDGRDARSPTDTISHSLWLDVGKRTYFYMCNDTRIPAALKPLFEHLDTIEKNHRADAQ